MILNSSIITYLVCLFFSLLIGLVAAFQGLPVWKKWDISNPAEEQHLLEKKVYLIITLLSLGFIIQLVMIPLWFWSLQSMIPSIPGAMCLVGVHMVKTPLSFVASGLKLFMPAFYGYWFALHLLDRQAATQPFMKQKLLLLTPLGILLLIETALDGIFFFSVPPRQVSCCGSLFNLPGEDIPQTIFQPTWKWVIAFYILALFLLGQIIYFSKTLKEKTLYRKKGWLITKKAAFLETLFSVSIFAVFVFSLHTKISPLFLNLPSHHCVFCLCQEKWDTLLSFSMIFTGLVLFVIYFWVVSSAQYRDVSSITGNTFDNVLKWSGLIFTGGLILFSIHLFWIL